MLWERLDVPPEEQDLFTEGKEGFKPHVIEAVSIIVDQFGKRENCYLVSVSDYV